MFVGGCTMAEVAALRFLSQQVRFLVMCWFHRYNMCTNMCITCAGGRGKEMSLSRCLGPYYKLPKSDPNAVYLPPNAVYLLQCCFIAANIVWAGQCDNSLFPWKLYKINLTAQQTINTAIKISVNVNWCYSTPRLLLPNFSWQLIF